MNPQEPSVVSIDENNLDKECIRLPSDYLRYAHRAADRKRDLDEAEAELKVVYAELSKKVREEPSAYGLEKITEAAIPNIIITLRPYKEKLAEVQEARYEAELAQSVVWALEHKKRSLTLLVELHGMGYFSTPKVSERGREAVEEMTKSKVRKNRWSDED